MGGHSAWRGASIAGVSERAASREGAAAEWQEELIGLSFARATVRGVPFHASCS